MRCPRCSGSMYTEKFYDRVRSFVAWTCPGCGEILDETISTNRARSRSLFLG